MKSIGNVRQGFRIWIFLITLLAILSHEPVSVSSKPLDQLYTSNQLYELAYNSANNKDYINAARYLFAYTQQNPPEYANNPIYKKSIDESLNLYIAMVENFKTTLRNVDNDLKSCQRYPCNGQSSSLGIIFAEAPISPPQTPPNAAIVCTQPNYKGNCKILYIGDYSNFQSIGINDVVSSVMVGSQAKLTLYLHARFDSQSITFISNDPDLSNNSIDSKYSWNKNASAARVQWK